MSKKNAEDGEVDDTETRDAAPKFPESSQAVSSANVKSEAEKGSSETRSNIESKAEPPKPAAETQSVSDGKPLAGEDRSTAITPASSNVPNAGASQSEDAIKSSTPQPASIPKRPESVRTTPSAPSARPSPNLPNKPERPDPRSLRPDPRFPSRPTLPGETSREPRDMRSQDYHRRGDIPERNHQGPLERASGYGPRSHDHTGGDRQPPDRGDSNRGSERNYQTRNNVDDRSGRPGTRDHGPPMWDPERSARARQGDERVSSERGMAPLASQARPQGEGVVVNPERAALINGGLENRPGLSIRGQGEERSSRGSRPTSPRRADDRRPPHRSERPESDQAPSDRLPGRHNQGPRHRPDDSATASSRDQRLDRQGSSSNDYSREPRHQPPQQAAIDMNHGRLNQDPHYPSRQQDVPSERLPPASDIPSGPRSRNALTGSRGRNPPPPPPHVNTQQPTQPSLPSASNASGRQTPTGPSARSHMRNNSYHEQQPNAGQMPAPTTTPAADTTGVHPDRLKHIQPSPTDSHPPRPAPFSAKPPPTSPPQASPPSVPSGPRGNAPSGAPSGPSPTTRGPPSGPQFANDGTMRGSRSNRHPLTAVNNTLAQAGQGTSIRGRGGMRNSGPPTPHSGPPTPISGPGQDVRSEVSFPPQQSNGRPDLFTNRGTEPNGAGPSSSQPYGPRPPNQRQPSQRDEVPPSRPPPSGRRGDLMDESTHGGRTSSRHSAGRNDTPDRDGGRRSERDDGHRDRDAMRSDRDHGRDRERERDRDSGHDRRSEGGERHRESSSRRDDPSPLPPRRSGRGRESGPDVPPPPPPPPPPMHGQDERRGPGPGPGPGTGPAQGPRRGGDSRNYDSREDTGHGRGGGSRDDDMPPRKHPRGEEGVPYARGGGTRIASESKRPRRGQ
jgi:THO complex subunit 2